MEVKTRKSNAFGAPAEAVTPQKQRLLARGALSWLKLLDEPKVHFRFDIVEVTFVNGKPRASILENAFPLPEPYRWIC